MLNWIERMDPDTIEPLFSLEDARKRYQVVELDGNGFLVLNWGKENLWLKFAVLTVDSCDHKDEADTRLSVQFHGSGPMGYLRECRHTYWGEDGYLFYPNGKVIAAGLKALSEFFDDLA